MDKLQFTNLLQIKEASQQGRLVLLLVLVFPTILVCPLGLTLFVR